MHTTLKLLMAAFATLFLAATAQAMDPAVVGSIKTVTGSVFVISNDGSTVAHPGLKLHQGDKLRTGAAASVGIIFRDDTLLSLGAESELVIEEFLFSPGENKLSMILRLLKGMASYVSGKMAELAPESIQIQTPVATVGVRGTRFLVRIEG